MSLQPIPEGPLRTGFTTGACATACAKAALIALLDQKEVDSVEITLPLGEKVSFDIVKCSLSKDSTTCSTIKDAGDDPDVTHNAEIGCKVTLNDLGVIRFLRGEGVGLVTLPGLAIGVGEPAINPVPRQMITNSLNFVLHQFKVGAGVDVEIFVVNGKEIAKKTLNSRIGIVDGISILGTTGIVKPFSASAYIASITQGIDVALANGCREIVINSGGRTENMLKKKYAHLPEYAFIQYGNWIGETLEKIVDSKLERVTMGIMIGKAVKLAQGEFDTHSGKTTWDKNFIYSVATGCGYSPDKCQPILDLNMARRLTEIFEFSESEPFFKRLGELCFQVVKEKIPYTDLHLLLIDPSDKVIEIRN